MSSSSSSSSKKRKKFTQSTIQSSTTTNKKHASTKSSSSSSHQQQNERIHRFQAWLKDYQAALRRNKDIMVCFGTRHGLKIKNLFAALHPIFGRSSLIFHKTQGLLLRAVSKRVIGRMHLPVKNCDVFIYNVDASAAATTPNNKKDDADNGGGGGGGGGKSSSSSSDDSDSDSDTDTDDDEEEEFCVPFDFSTLSNNLSNVNENEFVCLQVLRTNYQKTSMKLLKAIVINPFSASKTSCVYRIPLEKYYTPMNFELRGDTEYDIEATVESSSLERQLKQTRINSKFLMVGARTAETVGRLHFDFRGRELGGQVQLRFDVTDPRFRHKRVLKRDVYDLGKMNRILKCTTFSKKMKVKLHRDIVFLVCEFTVGPLGKLNLFVNPEKILHDDNNNNNNEKKPKFMTEYDKQVCHAAKMFEFEILDGDEVEAEEKKQQK